MRFAVVLTAGLQHLAYPTSDKLQLVSLAAAWTMLWACAGGRK